MSFFAIGTTDPTVISADWNSVRELAQTYVGLVKEQQRHGPYFLGGYSYGGLLAYEMASIFKENGDDVAFVAMLDTLPWYPKSRTAALRLKSHFKESVTAEELIRVS